MEILLLDYLTIKFGSIRGMNKLQPKLGPFKDILGLMRGHLVNQTVACIQTCVSFPSLALFYLQ